MKKLLFALAAVLAVVLSLSAATATSAERAWTITDLGIDADWSYATAINNHGVVVGGSSRGGFVWRDGVTTFLSGNMWPQDINDRGQVVGQHYVASRGTYEPFLWQGGVVTELGSLGGSGWGGAFGINDRGQIVGVSVPANGGQHAFLWQDGVMTDLGTLGGSITVAYDVNNRGQVVGYSTTASGGPHPFLWQDGIMIDLGTLGGDYNRASAINDHGQVAGESVISGVPHPVIWKAGGISDLIGQSLGGSAYAVNKRGQVAGQIVMTAYSQHATVWQDGVMTDLGTLGGISSSATDINDRGQAVGYSTTATGYQNAALFSQR
jgi:probable HAF family extracellular repeat protein